MDLQHASHHDDGRETDIIDVSTFSFGRNRDFYRNRGQQKITNRRFV